MIRYQRVPLAVEALFQTDGRILPRRLHYGDAVYEVERILSVKRFCPQVVACIAPVEYTVQITGHFKKIYYEEETATWFSIREVSA